MSRQIAKAMFFLCLLYQQKMLSSSLDGTVTVVYKNEHHVFSNGESAQGYVRLNGGFTIVAGATATLDTLISVSSSIDLRDTGVMQLLKDLEFDSGLTLSSGGSINGRGSALILNSNLAIPASKTITFVGDTMIEGEGNLILFQEHARFVVSNNVTVTLRNCVVRSTRNDNVALPFLGLAGSNSKLAFDNVIIAPADDLSILTGQTFFHNTVQVTGTSAILYRSAQAGYIAPASTLYFGIGTTFTFAPLATTDNTLLRLQSGTSKLHFNGCSLNTTSTGMRLTTGTVLFENKVRINSNSDNGNQAISNSIVFGNSALGSSANVNVEILGAAHLTLKGSMNDDSV